MTPRQSPPRQWLITDERMSNALLPAIMRLPRGSGILFRHHGLAAGERVRLLRRVRRLAAARGLTLVDEASGTAARVHCAAEIRDARLRGTQLLLLSPLFPTRSHPGRRPLSRMRAAALARLAGKPLIALGGMDWRRYQQVRQLGFDGWAGLDAWTEDLP
jgi:thiamine-phosphate pyrophosphorylase